MRYFARHRPLGIVAALVLGGGSYVAPVGAESGGSLRGEQRRRLDRGGVTGTFLVKEIETEGHHPIFPDGDGEAIAVGTGNVGGNFFDRRLKNNGNGNKDKGRRRHLTYHIQMPDGTIQELTNGPPDWVQDKRSGIDEIELPEGSMEVEDGRAAIDLKGKSPVKKNRAGDGNGGNGGGRGGGFFDRALKIGPYSASSSPLPITSHEDVPDTGVRTVLAVRILMNGGVEYNHRNESGLSDDVFGNGNDAHNLKSQYEACSFGALTLNKAPNRPKLQTSNCADCTPIANGVVTVRVNANMGDHEDAINNKVSEQLYNTYGVSAQHLADLVMYCHPKDTFYGVAYAYLNSWLSVYNHEWCTELSSQMHEVGEWYTRR